MGRRIWGRSAAAAAAAAAVSARSWEGGAGRRVWIGGPAARTTWLDRGRRRCLG